MVSSQETLRRLAIFDEGFVTAGSGHDLATTPAPGPKTALPQAGVPVAIRSSAVCLEWSAALAPPGRWPLTGYDNRTHQESSV